GPVFVVLEGWACRYKILPNGARQVLAFLMPGDVCDFHSGIRPTMDHGVQAITSALVARIEGGEMDAIMSAHPTVAKAMYIAQLVEEDMLRSWITSIGRRTSTERVAQFLSEIYVKATNAGFASEDRFVLPLTQILLADALAMTPVHLNRVFRELRVSGGLMIKRGSLIISDPARLVQLAGFDEHHLDRRLMRTPLGEGSRVRSLK
ncbi:MAG: Crp/Fnr family transcriptional regulator, partial [Caulobacteraceae bacterium]